MVAVKTLASALALLLVGGRAEMHEACSEEEVEALEESEAEDIHQELLQHEMRHIKAGEKFELDKAPLVNFAEMDALNEKELALRLESQEKVLATLSEEVESSKEEVHRLIDRRHQAMSGQVQPAAPSSGPVDCEKYPMFCDAKVNCAKQPLTADERKAYDTRLATTSGKANQRSWCLAYPMYATSVQKCIVEGDPGGYAKALYESQKKLKLVSADAIYCFVAGHCNNTEVADTTTVEQSEAICDRLYGHDRWTNIGWTDFLGVMNRALEMGRTHKLPKEWNVTGWSSLVKLAHHEAEISAMTACAMGNFQCDVAYCKANYCDDPAMRAQFGNLSWVYPDN